MPFLDHFDMTFSDPNAKPNETVVLATLAELERAIRDRECRRILVEAPSIGYVAISKAEARDKLSSLRHYSSRPETLRAPAIVYRRDDGRYHLYFANSAQETIDAARAAGDPRLAKIPKELAQ